jgi:hypothetical protein
MNRERLVDSFAKGNISVVLQRANHSFIAILRFDEGRKEFHRCVRP